MPLLNKKVKKTNKTLQYQSHTWHQRRISACDAWYHLYYYYSHWYFIQESEFSLIHGPA